MGNHGPSNSIMGDFRAIPLDSSALPGSTPKRVGRHVVTGSRGVTGRLLPFSGFHRVCVRAFHPGRLRAGQDGRVAAQYAAPGQERFTIANPDRGRQTVCKPGSVRPQGCSLAGATQWDGPTIPQRRASRRPSCAHPGRQGGTAPRGHLRAARRPYSVLLPVGFTLPPPLPAARCALAAPFHPCPRGRGRFVFCGTVPGVAPAGR